MDATLDGLDFGGFIKAAHHHKAVALERFQLFGCEGHAHDA
jgi:hypothetical protein